MRNDSAGGDRASKLLLYLNASLNDQVHIRFKEANGRPTISFRSVERAICSLQQLIWLVSIVWRKGSANSYAKSDNHLSNFEGFRY